jgi:hypothetical protein
MNGYSYDFCCKYLSLIHGLLRILLAIAPRIFCLFCCKFKIFGFLYLFVSDLDIPFFFLSLSLAMQLLNIIVKLTEEKNSALEQNRKLRDELVSSVLFQWVLTPKY